MDVGYDKASTNRIAKVAGVSIGSLYQYFPNKEAIVMEVANRHQVEMLERFATMSIELLHEPIDVAVRTYVKVMLEAHAVDPEVHTVLTQQVMHLGLDRMAALQRRTSTILEGYISFHRDKVRVKDVRMAALVLSRAVSALVHSVVMDAPELLADPAFEDEVVDLVLRYLLP